jgi:membrane protease subunit (stomatin/prohibitin family)
VLDFFKKQFIDVIEWVESTDGVLAYRFPMQDQEIQNGAQLTVRDSQMALFVNEGLAADAFVPGRYTLNTNTLPLLTNLKNWDKLFQSPFKSDVYFFSTREQIDQRWGTQAPVTVRDKTFGAVRLRAHGTYSYYLSDPKVFYEKISGTRERYTVDELDGQLRSIVMTSLGSLLGGSEVDFLDMAANQLEFSNRLKESLQVYFAAYGLTLRNFFVQSITLPEELQAHFDKAISMRMVGDLRQYAQFQAAESLPVAAANEGGLAGLGAGLGAGVGIGQVFASTFGNPIGAGGTPVTSAEDDPLATIEKLHGLLKQGILTQDEFDAKKAELLKKIK